MSVPSTQRCQKIRNEANPASSHASRSYLRMAFAKSEVLIRIPPSASRELRYLM